MPQDTPDAVSPLAPSEGSFDVPEAGVRRRWLDARDVSPALRDELLAVIDVSYNHEVSWYRLPVAPVDHFEWKFRDRPSGTTIGMTEEPNGRVIGFVASARRVWFLRGRPYVVRAGLDLCRLPEWQGRGLDRAFRPYQGRDWHPSEDFSFEYFTHPADRFRAIRRGEQAPANETHDYTRQLRLQPLRRARDLASHARALLPRLPVEPPEDSATTEGDAGASALSRTSRVLREQERTRADQLRETATNAGRFARSLLARRPTPRPGDWTIATIDRFEAHLEPFLTEAISQFDFVGERSPAYLNWRFCDRRAGPFTVRLARNSVGEPLGYATTRILDGGAALTDILALPGREEVAESLIRDAIRLARGQGATAITTRLPQRHPYLPALARTGFYDAGHLAGELISPRHTLPEELSFLDSPDTRVHHVLADSDDV